MRRYFMSGGEMLESSSASGGWIKGEDHEAECERRVKKEREKIVRELERSGNGRDSEYDRGWRCGRNFCIERIKSRSGDAAGNPEKGERGAHAGNAQDMKGNVEIKPLERIEVGVYTEAYVINSINALVDTVNALLSLRPNLKSASTFGLRDTT